MSLREESKMGHIRSLVSFAILTMFAGLGFLFVVTDDASAGLQPCTIGIEKVAIPADNTPFDFSVTGDLNFGFTLQDPLENSTSFNLIVSDTIDVTEIVPPGWVLEGIECIDPPGVDISEIPFGRRFQCVDMTGPGDTAICTFTNRMEPPPQPCQIEIIKTATPADNTPFDFSVTGDQTFDFTLRDPDQNSLSFNLIFNDTVDVAEAVPAGWALEGIECTDQPGLIISEIPSGRSFQCVAEMGPGNTAQCTFTNRVDDAPIAGIPSLNEWGLLSLAVVLGITGIVVFRLRRKTA